MGWIAQTVHQPNDKITSETMHDIRKKSKKMMYVSQRIEAVQSEYIPLYQARSDELGYVNDAADRIEYLEAYMKKI
jgi:CHAD domain-containing protein